MMTKTMGTQAARVIAALQDSGQAVFRLADVRAITGLSAAAVASFVRNIVDRGLATRVKPGLFVLVPSEMGSATTYLGDPYVLAREIIHPWDYYLSHGSAMDIHRMTTQPQLAVTVSTPAVRRPLWVHGTEYRFVRWSPAKDFGVESLWVTKQDSVRASNLERTIIDGLERPRYCGGVAEVALGLWRRHADMDLTRLADCAVQSGVAAVCKRLGFILELLGMGDSEVVGALQGHSKGVHVLLDPLLPPAGPYTGRWRVRVNLDPQEILAALGA
jgi:predicted transcriptional regulator of viral defense system